MKWSGEVDDENDKDEDRRILEACFSGNKIVFQWQQNWVSEIIFAPENN